MYAYSDEAIRRAMAAALAGNPGARVLALLHNAYKGYRAMGASRKSQHVAGLLGAEYVRQVRHRPPVRLHSYPMAARDRAHTPRRSSCCNQ